jgi:FkbM family methyltransferase
MISKGELDFFNIIKDNCSVIFDVGCRMDIHYLEMKPEAQFHLFEPNEVFFKVICKKVEGISTKVILNNFGLGNKTEQLLYYQNTQSFPKRVTHTISDPVTAKYCNVKRFTEYLTENNIEGIDFLKIDTEGYEPEILYDNVNFIKSNVKYIQFEYASTWLDKSKVLSIYDVYETYKDVFKFYYLYDENHPMCKCELNMIIEMSYDTLGAIEGYMKNAYGYNIAMIRI